MSKIVERRATIQNTEVLKYEVPDTLNRVENEITKKEEVWISSRVFGNRQAAEEHLEKLEKARAEVIQYLESKEEVKEEPAEEVKEEKKEEVKSNSCEECEKEFKTEQGLKLHITKMHS